MFETFPELIKQQILELLAQEKFVAAKTIRDSWIKKQQKLSLVSGSNS